MAESVRKRGRRRGDVVIITVAMLGSRRRLPSVRHRPRATIEIRGTQPKTIGEHMRIRTRRGKAPLRIDRCLMPGSTRPVRCPTA